MQNHFNNKKNATLGLRLQPFNKENIMNVHSLKKLLFAVVILFGTQTALLAQVGITAVPFLLIEPDSRATGMGNTGTAIADNAAAVFWNPAGLAFQSGNEVSITHANWLPGLQTDDIFYDYLVGKYEIEGIGTIGAHITYLNLGSQQRTNEQGQDLGQFNSYEIAGGLAYGLKISERFALGAGARFVYSRLVPSGTLVGSQQANAGTSIGLDFSGLYRTGSFNLGNMQANARFGFNISNLGPGVQYTDNAQQDPMPAMFRFGSAFTLDIDENNSFTLAADISKILARQDFEVVANPDPNAEDSTLINSSYVSSFEALFSSWGSFERFNGSETVELSPLDQLMFGVGLEYWYSDLFALRGGYYYENPENGDRQYITLGAGLRYDMFGVDFSYIIADENSPLANTIRLSALVKF